MRKLTTAVVMVMMLAGLAGVAARAEETARKNVTNKRCPVMNSPVSEKFRSEYKGQYVYFCCAGCIKMFEQDPEKYVAKMSAEDQAAIKANDTCPVTGDKITDHTRFIEHEGRKVYFCCDGCIDMYKQKMAEKKTETR